jgi:hypothetical protein
MKATEMPNTTPSNTVRVSLLLARLIIILLDLSTGDGIWRGGKGRGKGTMAVEGMQPKK